MKNCKLLIIFLFLTLNCVCQTYFSPTKLRTDLLMNTNMVRKNGISTNKQLSQEIIKNSLFQFSKTFNQIPKFDWQNSTNIKNSTAWRILVASSLQLLNKNIGNLWDSKKQAGNQHPIKYAGTPLLTGHIYYWKVQQWDEFNVATPFSESTSFYLAPFDSIDLEANAPLAAEFQSPFKSKRLNGNQFEFDFKKDAFGQLYLHLKSNKTDSIIIEVAEAKDSSGDFLKSSLNIRYKKIKLLLLKGERDYIIEWPIDEKRNSRNPILMPNYIGEVYPFRYVKISGLNGLISKPIIKRKIIFYPFNINSSEFTSSDSILNQIWELCKYSMKATSFSGYYVDGDRERLPYEADALINQLSHYAVDAEYNIARRTMAYLIFHPTWPTEWSLQNTMMAWNDYLYTGDKTFIEKYYSELKNKILISLATPNGLISTLSKPQSKEFLESIHITKVFDGKQDLKDIVDWPIGERDGFVFCDYNAVVNAFYYKNLLLMQKIALTIGKFEEAQFYSQKAKEVYHTYQNMFINPVSGLVKDGDTTNHISLHANMFALAFGLVPNEYTDSVIEFIKSKQMACSVYGAQFLLEALYDSDQAKYAFELLTAKGSRSWYNMIHTGSTITMEAWDKKYKPNLDLNHAWGAAPANIIVRKLMGVEPLSPGADTVSITPKIENLKFAKLKTTLLKGELTIDYNRNAIKETYKFSIPGATVALLKLKPKKSNTKLLINGRVANLKTFNGSYENIYLTNGKNVVELYY